MGTPRWENRNRRNFRRLHCGKIILLFVRMKNEDEFKNTMSFVFLGDARFIKYSGSKPMSITWELSEPIPHYLWKESAKLAVG